MSWTIRAEAPGDADAISALITGAFLLAEHCDGTEASIIERLRDCGALTISLVADTAGVILGQVAFSPVTISDGAQGWYGLGPIAVVPRLQRGGIGSALMEAGLARLRELGASGCVVLGDPAYYGRFGFAHDPALAFPGPPAEYFQRVLLDGPMPAGIVSYHPAFG